MTDLRRSIKCSNCGVESNFSLNSDLTLNELVVQGKCHNCSSSMQLNFNIVGSTHENSLEKQPVESQEPTTVNLEEELFNPTDMFNKSTNDDIEDIIDG